MKKISTILCLGFFAFLVSLGTYVAAAEEAPALPPLPEEGTPADYFAFINTVMSLSLDAQTQEEFMEKTRQRMKLLAAATDKIMEHPDATDVQYAQAFQLKLRVLMFLTDDPEALEAEMEKIREQIQNIE